MQFASFDLRDPVFDAGDLSLSVQVVTLENLYGLDVRRVRSRREGLALEVRADGLAWAGQQERAPGEVVLRVERTGRDRWRARVSARAPHPIRCVKLLVRGLDAPLVVCEEGADVREIGESGEVFGYPGRLATPALCLRTGGSGGRVLAARCEDPEVREKRIALSVERLGPLAGRGVVELAHDELAPRFAPTLETPWWILARGVEPAAFVDEQVRFVAGAHRLQPFERRGDVPAWARALRLVATLHGMHWSGRVFLDYDDMLAVLRFLAARVDPASILAYLPGWEGRYYWRYGRYAPDERLGGERGFARLCDGARDLGVHLMPMFGAHCVNRTLPDLEDLAERARMASATGNVFHGNTPDWDLSRAHDPGWQAWLNPGNPEWREALAGQIESLAGRFGFDAVFLDTAEVWINDPHHPVFEGLRALVQRLRSSLGDVLLAAEYDYDALLALFPLFQRAWWTRAPDWTRRYVRRFGHLCEGEPEGRTGVHELGIWRAGMVEGAPGLLPTIAFQDDTVTRSRERIETFLAGLREGDGSGGA